jgi:hypothetical protein
MPNVGGIAAPTPASSATGPALPRPVWKIHRRRRGAATAAAHRRSTLTWWCAGKLHARSSFGRRTDSRGRQTHLQTRPTRPVRVHRQFARQAGRAQNQPTSPALCARVGSNTVRVGRVGPGGEYAGVHAGVKLRSRKRGAEYYVGVSDPAHHAVDQPAWAVQLDRAGHNALTPDRQRPPLRPCRNS